jgi:hypothetical protein
MTKKQLAGAGVPKEILAQMFPASGHHKYRARAAVDPVHGRFASQREYRRWGVLYLLWQQGEIQHLRRQVEFQLKVNGKLVTRYIADFVYEEAGELIVEDCKGFRTPEYKLKKKLLLACHGLSIRET